MEEVSEAIIMEAVEEMLCEVEPEELIAVFPERLNEEPEFCDDVASRILDA
jgi:hypothetical protein